MLSFTLHEKSFDSSERFLGFSGDLFLVQACHLYMLLTYLVKHKAALEKKKKKDELQGQIHYNEASLHLVELSKQRIFCGDLGTIKMMKY